MFGCIIRFIFFVDMIRLHRINPSICFLMSLLMGECAGSQSAEQRGCSGFQRDRGRLEKRDNGNLWVFSRVEHKPCPGVSG